MLEVEDLSISFGGIAAVRPVTLRLDAGQFVGLIGPNGAAKSSTLLTIVGQVQAFSGRLLFKNQDLMGLGPAEREHKVMTLFPRLRERAQQRAGSLSGGEQQILAIGRALMAGPELLLVDELSLGLMPKPAIGKTWAACCSPEGARSYLPMQKDEKIRPSKSSELKAPVI